MSDSYDHHITVICVLKSKTFTALRRPCLLKTACLEYTFNFNGHDGHQPLKPNI